MPPMLAFVGAAALAVVLNEVLYDPDGADDGFEFVELAAAPGADSSASLRGLILETGNGARPGEWTVAWIGGAADSLRGGIFVLGEELLEPAPDVIADLDLQNGPDACRLRAANGADVLGWGAPLDASFTEVEAAEDAASGLSLARLPDGVDTNCNSCDWRAAAPSPGAFNAPDVALVVDEAALPPPDLAPGSAWEFAWNVRNVGRAPWSGTLRLTCDTHPDEILVEHAPFADAPLAPGARANVVRWASPPPGIHLLRGEPPLPSGSHLWRGAGGDLAITEVYSRPADDEPEWIELRSIASTPLDLAAFTFEDEAGTVASLMIAGSDTLGARSVVLALGAFVIVAADTSAFRTRWGLGESVLLFEGAPWPSLNHTASAGGVAERVRLLLAGEILEECAIPGGIAEGFSWERTSTQLPADDPASWGVSLDSAGGTPGRPNSRDGDRAAPVTPQSGELAAIPRAFLPTRDGPALLVLTTRAPSPRCTMTLLDASGIPVRELDAWRAGPLEHRALWDGRDDAGADLPLGVYIALASAASEPPARSTIVLLR